jgi:hypothetical protein
MVPEQRHMLLLWLNIYDAITLGIRRSIAVRCRECTLPETGFKPRMGYVQRYRSCSFNHEHDLCTYPMVAGAGRRHPEGVGGYKPRQHLRYPYACLPDLMCHYPHGE